MSSIKSEPLENQTVNKNESFQQELISNNGKTTLQKSLNNSLTSSSTIDPTDVEKIILELCKQNTDGITDQIIQNAIPNISPEQRIAALNRLLSLNKLDLLKSPQFGLLYRLKDLDTVMKGSDSDEKLVYSIVKESGNKGIWIRDISVKTNLGTQILNKTIKNLESKKLIKHVNSVYASKKKVYMLFDLEPDRSLTGGSWYSGKEFENEFVEVLNEQCYLYLVDKKLKSSQIGANKKILSDPIAARNASYATTKEITDYIKNLGISKVVLNLEDIECILNTLVYDGKIERTVMHSTVNNNKSNKNEHVSLFRAVNSILPTYNMNEENDESMEVDQNNETASNNKTKNLKVKGCGSSLVRIPCGICPIIDDCSEDGPISPKTCIYMKEWLEF
jgi:DNA-directed RNA polymerase III subunit RPC6